MKIRFNGSKPSSYYISYSVIGNENVDRLEFVLNSIHDGFDLTQLTPRVNVKSLDGSYKDVLTSLDNTVSSDGTITVYCVLRSPLTSYEELEMQLVFTGPAGTWQSEKFNLYLKGTMDLEEDENPTFSQALQAKAEIIVKDSKNEFPSIGNPKNIYICDEGIFSYETEKGYILHANNYLNINEIIVNRGAE